ncbi:ATP-binding protein [bacterium]|nr:ATP-binding protein [bacterium]
MIAKTQGITDKNQKQVSLKDTCEDTKQDDDFRFSLWRETIRSIRPPREERTWDIVSQDVRNQLAKLEFLVLDELGYVPASKAGTELLFDVIVTAYERNRIVVMTNLYSAADRRTFRPPLTPTTTMFKASWK